MQIWYCCYATGAYPIRINSVFLHKHRYIDLSFKESCLSADDVPVGAALWAADIEANNTLMTEMTVPKSTKEATKKAE